MAGETPPGAGKSWEELEALSLEERPLALPQPAPIDGTQLHVSGSAAPQTEADASDDAIDHALRDALAHPKNRLPVLRLEAEVEAFLLNTSESQHVFPPDMSSYERLLAHRTAQHWGMDTSTISHGADQGRIVATRTPASGIPKVRLGDVPLVEPAGMPGSAPRVLVRRRPDRGGAHPHREAGGPSANGGSQFRSVEERQAEYHRARARIFGEGGGNGGYPGGPPMRGGPQPPDYPPPGGGGQPGFAGPPPPPPQQQGGSSGGGGGRKAQLRNKEQDLADPDFRRGRHGPRFDPGYGDDPLAAQGMYIRPAYTSEFPMLPGGGPRVSPRTVAAWRAALAGAAATTARRCRGG